MHARYLVISCSLNVDSRSRRLAQMAFDYLQNHTHSVELIHLSEWDLPLCDGGPCYEEPQVRSLTDRIARTAGVLLAAPVYNFDVNAAAKNLIELTGSAWNEKVVGLVSVAGGQSSYMSVMGLANSLMLDFRCFIVPLFVYATTEAFNGEERFDTQIEGRLRDLADRLREITEKLAPTPQG